MTYDIVGVTYDIVGQHAILVTPTMLDLRYRMSHLLYRMPHRKQYRRYDVAYDIVGVIYDIVGDLRYRMWRESRWTYTVLYLYVLARTCMYLFAQPCPVRGVG